MNKEQYFDFHKKTCENMYNTTVAKNSDYTGDTSDPFSNFRNVERLGICTVEQGFLTRITDKVSRIASLTDINSVGQKVKDEAVTDTLIDLANYCILMAGYLESKKQTKGK